MSVTKDNAIDQLNRAIQRHAEIRSRSQFDDSSDMPAAKVVEVATLTMATIDRVAPRGSEYLVNAKKTVSDYSISNGHILPILLGILKALLADYQEGHLRSMEELIHSDLFSDFLEMAEYFLAEGYKDPAAVITGGVLEEHLRKLCLKHEIAIQNSSKNKSADLLNAELAKMNVYEKLDQKNVTAWLDLRNKAAHAQWADYTKEQVNLFLAGVKDFISRHLA